jgi:hypothetical protein
MQRLFIISLLFLRQLPGISQPSMGADSMLIYEYRYFTASDRTAKNNELLGKLNFCLREKKSDAGVLILSRRIDPELIMDARSRITFLWNSALLGYMEGQREFAAFSLREYLKVSGDSSSGTMLLSFLINKHHDSTVANNNMLRLMDHDTIFAGLRCFGKVALYEKKHRNLHLISSALVPGSGTMMNGYLLKGLTSMVLSGGAAFGIVKLVESGLYLNAVLWGTGVGLKFYTGNIRLTEKTFDWSEDKNRKRLSDQCEMYLRRILTKYPLQFK